MRAIILALLSLAGCAGVESENQRINTLHWLALESDARNGAIEGITGSWSFRSDACPHGGTMKLERLNVGWLNVGIGGEWSCPGSGTGSIVAVAEGDCAVIWFRPPNSFDQSGPTGDQRVRVCFASGRDISGPLMSKGSTFTMTRT